MSKLFEQYNYKGGIVEQVEKFLDDHNYYSMSIDLNHRQYSEVFRELIAEIRKINTVEDSKTPTNKQSESLLCEPDKCVNLNLWCQQCNRNTKLVRKDFYLHE